MVHKSLRKIVGLANYVVTGDVERTVLEKESRMESKFQGTEEWVGSGKNGSYNGSLFWKMFCKGEKEKNRVAT